MAIWHRRLLLVLVIGLVLVGTVSADTAILFVNSDGYSSEETDQEWIPLRNDVGDKNDQDDAYIYVMIAATTSDPNLAYNRRGIFSYGANATITAGSTVTGATLTYYLYTKANGLGTVNLSLIDYTGAIPSTNGDYDSTTFTRQADDTPYDSATSGAWNTITLTNLTGIKTDGSNTTYMMANSADVDNTSLVWASGASSGFDPRSLEYSEGTYASYMTITFTPAAGGDPPVADFTANETTVCLYDYVQFTDNSTNSPDTWFWLFGDSQDSHDQNPVHYWDTAGSYTINLTAGNDAGENTTSKTDYITAVDCAPAANFTANETSVCLGDPILFMDNSTLYPAPSIFDYLDWDFGDGNTTAGFRDDGYDVPVFTYGYAGTFDVSMEITTKYGSDLLSRKAYITVIDCVGDPDFYANVTCVIGEKPVAIQFTGYCPDPTFKNHWDWGDGNTTDDTQSPEHVYEDYGTYNVSHMCWAAPNPQVFENKTDYIVIGVNGTVCADDCGNTTGNCTTCTRDPDGEEYPNYLLIGACIGLLFGYITIRRKEMI